MTEVIALLIGFAAGATAVVLAGSKVVSEIKKAKADLEHAIINTVGNALGVAQSSGVPKQAEKQPVAGSNPTPVGMTGNQRRG